jgi:hypothetical protein
MVGTKKNTCGISRKKRKYTPRKFPWLEKKHMWNFQEDEEVHSSEVPMANP